MGLLGLRTAPKEDLQFSPGFGFRSAAEGYWGVFSHVPRDVMAARYVFIWHDSHRSSLQALYDWPFRILEAGPKNFVVDKGGNQELV